MSGALVSVMKTAILFLGGFGSNPKIPIFGSKVPRYMERANINFIEYALNVTMEERPVRRVDLDESEVHSGDFFAVMRLDGIDQIIMYGTGSHVGHSTVALWMEEGLMICES
jgi:hypothetical protein